MTDHYKKYFVCWEYYVYGACYTECVEHGFDFHDTEYNEYGPYFIT